MMRIAQKRKPLIFFCTLDLDGFLIGGQQGQKGDTHASAWGVLFNSFFEKFMLTLYKGLLMCRKVATDDLESTKHGVNILLKEDATISAYQKKKKLSLQNNHELKNTSP